MIHIVDYGLGNLQAFMTTFKRLGVDAVRARTSDELIKAERLILPGVGAFDHAMTLLNQSGMLPVLETLVLDRRKPILGICVGMQILASSSEEGALPGLGWIPGVVRSFKSDTRSSELPLPHMGWNDVNPRHNTSLFSGLESGERFYFLHSFFFDCNSQESVEATSTYGLDFSCAVSSGNIHGVQFHPEKSHHAGLRLLRNFSEI